MVIGPWSMVNGQLPMVNDQISTVDCHRAMVNGPWFHVCEFVVQSQLLKLQMNVFVRRLCFLNVFWIIYVGVFVFVFGSVFVFEEVPSRLDRDLGKWTVPEPLFSPKGVSMKAAPVLLSIRRKKMTPSPLWIIICDAWLCDQQQFLLTFSFTAGANSGIFWSNWDTANERNMRGPGVTSYKREIQQTRKNLWR